MTEAAPSPTDVFTKRASQWDGEFPLAAALSGQIAADPSLADCLTGLPDTPIWAGPDLIFAAATRLLRTDAAAHRLAEYWPTLGGTRPIDDALAATFRDFLTADTATLRALCAAWVRPRQNDPLTAVSLWPGIAWAANRIAGPVALLELGAAAGLCLLPDRYGYRYGDTALRGDRQPVLNCRTGDTEADLAATASATVDVAARIALELKPIRADDPDAVAWLRDSVLPDKTAELDRLDTALNLAARADIDWAPGDYFDELPRALAQLPPGVTPIVYGAHTLCCADRRERLPELLAASGRDLVWIAVEHRRNALELVSQAPDDDTDPVLLTAVEYRDGVATEGWVLAEVAPWNDRIDWAPKPVTLDG